MLHKVKNDDKGFTVVEGLLVIITVAVVAFVGYYVWHANAQSKTNTSSKNSTQASSKQSVATASTTRLSLYNGAVTLSNPNGWSNTQPSGPSCLTTVDSNAKCLDSLTLSPTDATKAKAGDAFGLSVSVSSVDGSPTTADWFWNDFLGGELAGNEDTTSSTAINGYDAYTRTQTDKSYTDEWYVLRKDAVAVVIYTRVSDTHFAPGGTTVDQHTDNTKYQPQILEVVHSVSIK